MYELSHHTASENSAGGVAGLSLIVGTIPLPGQAAVSYTYTFTPDTATKYTFDPSALTFTENNAAAITSPEENWYDWEE